MNAVRRALYGLLVSCLLTGALAAQEPPGPSAVVRDGLIFRNGVFLPGPYLLDTSETDRSIEVVVAGFTLDRFLVTQTTGAVHDVIATPLPSYEIPAGVDTLRESGYPAYLHRFLDHHVALVGPEEALDLAEAHASNCPLVKRLQRGSGGLLLFDRTGDPYFVSAGTDLVPDGLSRSEALALAVRTLQAYHAVLSRGGAILHFDGTDVFLPRARVVDVLIPSLEILDDPNLEREEKRSRLKRRWRNDALVNQMLRGYRRVPELWGALEAYETGGR